MKVLCRKCGGRCDRDGQQPYAIYETKKRREAEKSQGSEP